MERQGAAQNLRERREETYLGSDESGGGRRARRGREKSSLPLNGEKVGRKWFPLGPDLPISQPKKVSSLVF